MKRLTFLLLVFFVLTIPAVYVYYPRKAKEFQPFTPSIEENKESITFSTVGGFLTTNTILENDVPSEENKESVVFPPMSDFLTTDVSFQDDASLEVVSEIMVPVCKLYFDAHPSFKDLSGAFSPDGRYFAISNATSSFMTCTNLFDLKTGENLKRFNGSFNRNEVMPVAFSPDSQRLAFLSGKQINNSWYSYIVVWDIPEEKVINQIPLENNRNNDIRVYSLRFSEDGKKLLGVVGLKGYIWTVEPTGEAVKTYDTLISSFCYPDLSHAMSSDDKTGKSWLHNLETKKNMERVGNFTIVSRHADSENRPRMVFSDDNRLFAMLGSIYSRNRGNHLLVWDAATGSDICTVPLEYQLTAFTFLPGSHILVTASDPYPGRGNPWAQPFVMPDNPHIPKTTPQRKPVAKTETSAIIEFWDIDHLIWHKEKVNLFPRKIKTAYLEGDDDIHYMTASPDGKMLYMRSGKKVLGPTGNWPSIANGYIFALDPDNPPDLPAEIQLKASASKYSDRIDWIVRIGNH